MAFTTSPTANFATSPVALAPIELPGKVNYHMAMNPELSSGIKAAKDFLSGTLEKANGFNKRRGMVDERITRGMNEHQIVLLADKIGEETTIGYEKAKSALATSTANVEARLELRVALTPTANAAEIRSVMRAMKPAERSAALAAAFEAGDKEILGAVVSSPAFIHGCDPEQVTTLREVYNRKVAYVEHSELDEHRKATRYLEDSFPALGSWKARLYRGTKNHAAKFAENKAIMASYGIDISDD
ncbi:hypothetical protein [Sphingomonas sp. CFBP 8764]|uniref:hypothetical protein n=1 Tax=Sphingomonas sp. CFBP 8764 TaxID=2775275 RepID=UPI001782B705|nr:hypothetical protein [Sphingomonas sp. CFBP 8764]MBD8552637.1 hypothetical protein [Sphingomonas sp. CFBP 8764]